MRNRGFTLLLLFAALFLNFHINVFAIENTTPASPYPDFAYIFTGRDKCESFNRKLFIFNLKLNKYVIKPINIGWAAIMPKYGMDRFQNVYTNMNFLERVMGSAFQKDFKTSRHEITRFFINTTIGVAGMYDPAKSIFKIESSDEDMQQALACCKRIKQGPYLVLPIVRGSIRDLIGQLLDYPLRPCSYIPIAGGAINAFFTMNELTSTQPLIKKLDLTYADPYEITRQIDGFSSYIKAKNIDKEDVLKVPSQEIIKVKNNDIITQLKPDILLSNFNPQSPTIDAMRTSLFEMPKQSKSAWADISPWNKCFEKSIKTASVSVNQDRNKYKYRYVLQKNKTSPLAIIYPSIGEGIYSDHAATLAKILYDEGYSVVIQGSAFHWEFIRSMPKGYKPGMPYQDASYLRLTTAKILDSLEKKKSYKFGKRIMIGTSFGAMTSLFTAAQEDTDNTLNIDKYVAINPPIEMFFALRELDKKCSDWKNDSGDIKQRAAITAEKVVQMTQELAKAKTTRKPDDPFPFNEDEAKLITAFVMKQKLSDVVFGIENCSRCKKSTLYNDVNKMSFYDYGAKYLFKDSHKAPQDYEYETSLYSIGNFLKQSPKYKIYHTLDDYYVNPAQLSWLKNQSGDKTVLFSNGSHLGFLYRKEFFNAFKKDTELEEQLSPEHTVNNQEPSVKPQEPAVAQKEL